MPQPSLQDIAPILDPTGLVTLNASQIYQITSTAIPASAIGLNIETTDSALGVPIVPDANTNTKWKKYIWRRKSFNNTSKVKLYYWNDFANSDITFLRWVEITSDLQDAVTIANNALNIANEAKALSDAANSNSNTAQTVAQNAQSLSNALSQALTDLDAAVAVIQNKILTGIWITGDLRSSATTKVYSKISDEGWLLADGSAVSRTVFATLFAGIGTLYGVGDGVNTFNLPDCRGRTLVGAGQGSGLTNRVLGTSFGEENHVLLTNELPKHTHALSTLGKASATGNIDDAGGGLVGQMATFPSTDLTAITGNDEGHSNFQPSIAVSIYIKT